MRKALLTQGLTFVELLIVAAVSLTIFAALFGSYQYTLELMAHSRAKLSALSLATDRMEYFRSLPYDDVGTLSGIPNGVIPQNSTSTLNNIVFSERVLVEYVDDPADGQDGTGTPDSNGIPSDYKRVKLEYTWTHRNQNRQVALVSNIVPRSIESTAGGGTVRINVLDDQSGFLQGASVRLFNNTTTSTIDVTRFTDASGAALFSGAPAASDYQVVVNGTIGSDVYSTDQTYVATTSNPNPSVAPFAVLESDVSTLTFQIGALSDLDLQFLTSRTDDSVLEDFTPGSLIASSTNVSTSTGSLTLTDTLGVYDTSGIAYIGPISPASLDVWQALTMAATKPTNTSVNWSLYTFSGTSFDLIPDVDFPNNSVGSSTALGSIASLDPVAYPTIYVGLQLSTTDTAVTPTIDELGLYYRSASTPAGTITFGMTGTKQIGTQLDATPIYKVDLSTSTDSSGALAITDLEFDQYSVAPSGGYDIAMACPAEPIVHRAGIDSDVEMLLVADAAHTLRVQVVDTLGNALPGASVELDRTGYNDIVATDGCGQAFFTGGVTSNSDYTLTVTATGYTTNVTNSLNIDDDTFVEITMN